MDNQKGEKMKPVKSIVLILICCLSIIFLSESAAGQDKLISDGELIVERYLLEKRISLEPESEEYAQFLNSILWGGVMELSKVGTDFVKDQYDLEALEAYCIETVIQILYDDYVPGPPDPPAESYVEPQSFSDDKNQTFSYSRSLAIQYARDYYDNYNSSYPAFTSDCQNFVSQIVKRGGFGMSGDGDGCRSENTYSEWYMIPNPDPTIFCLGDGRYFEWSTGWTVVDHFKWYFTYNNSYAQNLGWTSSYSTAAIMLAPGDVIQLQILGSDGTWIGSHSVFVTKQDSTGLYVTSHTDDYLDKKLSDIPLSSSKRLLLIRFP